jgi:alkanesulfonate monooxygenase SsuD/methylene tetrahydromethanopterin reductase-like flavin-dependent oxidoreductase (luciferase family)
MEFGIFLNGYIPGPGAHETDWEHRQLLREAEYAVFADEHNWKYAWFGEHHGLSEYSHMSAPEVVMGYVAAQTSYIHLGTAITSLSPRKEHPVRYAERAAMLDHVTNNRFEWGTGRGAGSHELASFNIMDKDSTKAEWDEVVHEIPRMWEQVDYSHQGESFTVPTPHNVLPKPYGRGHPPIWVACGNPPTFAKAGEYGIGAIAFNFEPIYNLRGRIEAYKEAIADCKEPLGQYLNDNVMMTNGVICFEDRKKAREIALDRLNGYLVTMVNLYHDTMPKSPDAITWPNAPIRLRELAAGGDPDALLDQMIEGGYMMVGTPDEVSEQLSAYSSVGCDQIVFGLPQDLHRDEILELLETFGDKVIPEHDPDRVHSTDKYREKAVPKYSRVNEPLPDVEWPSTLPVTALAARDE